MDDSTLVTRKDAANRDKQYDMRTLVNHQISERICTPDFGLEYTWLGIISICHMAYFKFLHRFEKESSGVLSSPFACECVSCLLISSDTILLLQLYTSVLAVCITKEVINT